MHEEREGGSEMLTSIEVNKCYSFMCKWTQIGIVKQPRSLIGITGNLYLHESKSLFGKKQKKYMDVHYYIILLFVTWLNYHYFNIDFK